MPWIVLISLFPLYSLNSIRTINKYDRNSSCDTFARYFCKVYFPWIDNYTVYQVEEERPKPATFFACYSYSATSNQRCPCADYAEVLLWAGHWNNFFFLLSSRVFHFEFAKICIVLMLVATVTMLSFQFTSIAKNPLSFKMQNKG